MSPPVRPPLLPLNATPLERALADIDGRLDELTGLPIITVKSVDDAPAAALPYLAWERSVDVWDPDWPEATKRAVIRVAPEVHRYKGTRHAVQRALDALGVSTRIVEWHETDPHGPPYTFRVTAYARGRLYGADTPYLDPRLLDAIWASVMAAKPLSRAFSLAVGVTVRSPTGAAGIAVGGARLRVAPHAPARTAGRSRLGLAAIGAATAKHRLTVHASAS